MTPTHLLGKETMWRDASAGTKPPAKVLASTNRLAYRLLGTLLADGSSKDQQGLAVSAVSITLCLALLAGAASDTTTTQTQNEFYTKLGADSAEELRWGLSALLEALRNEDGTLAGGSAVYVKRGFHVSPEYARHAELFQAVVNAQHDKLADAVDEINSWVNAQTRGMIQELVDAGMLRNAHAVLLSALSFRGLWETQFEPKDTEEKYPFTLADSRKSYVPMMLRRSTTTVRSARGPGYTVACLPYRSQSSSPASPSVSFVGYLPNQDSTVEDVLARLPDGHEPLHDEKFSRFGLPRFEIETSLSLLPVLDKLDYPVRGDFSRMGGPGPSVVSEIVHRAKITVDEEGTRAAAATAVVMTRGGSLRAPQLPELIFDRPFVFSIVDDAGLALFTGVFSPS